MRTTNENGFKLKRRPSKPRRQEYNNVAHETLVETLLRVVEAGSEGAPTPSINVTRSNHTREALGRLEADGFVWKEVVSCRRAQEGQGGHWVFHWHATPAAAEFLSKERSALLKRAKRVFAASRAARSRPSPPASLSPVPAPKRVGAPLPEASQERDAER